VSIGFGTLMMVDGMGGGAGSDTTGKGAANSSLLCKVKPSGDSDRGMEWVTGELVEVSVLPPGRWAAAMSSEVMERAWLSIDTGRDDVVTRRKGCGA